jgi:hypothetical protein
MKEFLAGWFPSDSGWAHFWRTLEFGREDPALWVLGLVAIAAYAVWMYRRDGVSLGEGWRGRAARGWLTGLRLATLLSLFLVAMLPQERRSRTYQQPSKVAVLLDTSASMGVKDREPGTTGATGGATSATDKSRRDRVVELLKSSPLVAELRKSHGLHVYTFDGKVTERARLPRVVPVGPSTAKSDAKTPEVTPDWEGWLNTAGVETRLGEVLQETLRTEADETLSGIVVVTDGGANAGVDPAVAVSLAKASKSRLFPVGVGSTVRPINVQVAGVQAPAIAHMGDKFTLTAFVTAQGLAGKRLAVELLARDGGQGEPSLIESRDITVPDDGVPVTVEFDQEPKQAGRREYLVRARATEPVAELIATDNEERTTVDVIERKTKVLVIAGGPMRDYQFVRNLLFRDKSIDLHVLLQTAAEGTSQESAQLLGSFPDTREALFEYDVIVAFDPDWEKIRGTDGQALEMLAEWVFAQAGGLVFVAGDVHTPRLAGGSTNDRPGISKLMELLPVTLDATLPDVEDTQGRPHPLELTPEGRAAGFLQVADSPEASDLVWKDFAGVYRCYPVDGVKSAATVYARFSDPLTGGEPPPLVASQYYGAGRTLYLGSPEFWRLRAVDENAYDRFWIKLTREAGQGRLLRGTNRGLLMVEKKTVPMGGTVQLRARVLDARFQNLTAERVLLEVFDPSGRAVSPAVELLAEKSRPGAYQGAFVASQPGTYSLELPIPDSSDEIRDTVTVKLPSLEFDHPEQNVELLKTLANEREGGGKYLTLDEAATALPGLLVDKTVEKVQFETPLPLWDRPWVLGLLAGLLSVEWLTRKLWKLA